MSKARTRESDVTLDNIELIKEVLARGLDVEMYLTDDAVWTIPGFGSYEGKREILAKLLGPMHELIESMGCLLYTSPSPRDGLLSRMPSSA